MTKLGDIALISQKWHSVIGIIITVFCLSAWINAEIMTAPWWSIKTVIASSSLFYPLFVTLSFLMEWIFPLVCFGALLRVAGTENYIIYIAKRWMRYVRGAEIKSSILSHIMMGGVSIRPNGAAPALPLRELPSCALLVQSIIEIMPPLYGGAGLLIVYYAPIENAPTLFYGMLPAFMLIIGGICVYHLSIIQQGYMISAKKIESPPHTLLASQENRVCEGKLHQSFASFALGVLNAAIISCVGVIVGYGVHHLLAWMRVIYHENDIYIFIQLVLGIYILLLWISAKTQAKQTREWSEISDAENPKEKNIKGHFYHLLPIFVFLWVLVVEEVPLSRSALWACAMALCVLLTAEAFLSSFQQLRRLKQPNIMRELLEGAGKLRSAILLTAERIVPLAGAMIAAGILLCVCYYYEIPSFFASLIEGNKWRCVIIASLLSAILSMIKTPVMVQYFIISLLYKEVFEAFSSPASLYFTLFYGVILVQLLVRVMQQRLWKKQDLPYIALVVSVLSCVLWDSTWLLQGVHSVEYGAFIALIGVVAILLLSAGLQGFFMMPCGIYQRALLCVAAFTLLIPTGVLHLISPDYMQKITQMNVDAAKYIVYFPALCMVGIVYMSQQIKIIRNGKK